MKTFLLTILVVLMAACATQTTTQTTTKTPAPTAEEIAAQKAARAAEIDRMAKAANEMCEKSGHKPGTAEHFECYSRMGRLMLGPPPSSVTTDPSLTTPRTRQIYCHPAPGGGMTCTQY